MAFCMRAPVLNVWTSQKRAVETIVKIHILLGFTKTLPLTLTHPAP